MTQEYLSRKIVTAWREDRTGEPPVDAVEGFVPEVMPGYAVKYNDGYTSWCPKVKFEEDTLPLGNVSHLPLYQQRLLAETIELNQRTESLGEFLETSKTNPAIEASMSPRGFELLKKQHVLMGELLIVLDQRIEDMSDFGGLAAMLKADPLLESTVVGQVETLETPVIDRGQRWKPLGQDDSWLLEKLAAASKDPRDNDMLNQWGLPEARLVEVQVPVVHGRVNLLGLLVAESGLIDSTDSIGTFGVKEILNAAGEKLVISEGTIRRGPSQREIALVVRVFNDTTLDLSLNKETGNLTIIHTDAQSLVGATMTVVLSLHNLNRRQAQ